MRWSGYAGEGWSMQAFFPINQILDNLIVTPIEKADEKLKSRYEELYKKGCFNKYNDKVMLITFKSGLIDLYFIISHAEKYYYDFTKNTTVQYLFEDWWKEAYKYKLVD